MEKIMERIFEYDWLFIYTAIAYTAFSVGTYLVPFFLESLLFEQNLKRKYDAEWALVTGGSSGIGRAVVEKLAAQGINVVIAALDDDLMRSFFEDICQQYPELQFRKCTCNLGAAGYMQDIIAATEDLKISLVFNNAGFITTGFFAETNIGRLTANFECNATSMVHITHHFANKMQADGIRGAIAFTSSPANVMPQPFAAIYGSTKAFVTEFGASLAAELRGDGIDCLVVHPSPVDTQFYTQVSHDLETINFFKRTGVSPTRIASCFFKGFGRVVVYDQGWFSLVAKLGLKVFDYNLMANLMRFLLPLLPDYAKVKRVTPAPAPAKKRAAKSSSSKKGRGRSKSPARR